MPQKTDLPPLPNLPQRGTFYRHLGNGKTYWVVGVGYREKTLEAEVAYLDEDDVLWIRPHAEFTDGRFVQVGGGIT